MKSQNNYYNQLDDIPAFNFNKFIATGDPDLLAKNEIKAHDEADVQSAWDELFQQYIDFMGLGDRYDLILRKENRVCKLITQIYADEKRHLMAILKQEKKELSLLKEKIALKPDASDESAAMGKYLGFDVNDKQMSAKKYFSYIKLIKSDG